ncbi:hypothetical protein G9A89_009666 [Geosiphon pyriformis]|nr:hypothetical protein G9A89_009666 [Geosiphon pyriformis]
MEPESQIHYFQNRANWQPFTSARELQKFLDSTDIETIVEGVSRFRQHFNFPSNKDSTFNKEVEKRLQIFYDYLQISPECTEVFKIWDLQQAHFITRLQVAIPDLLSKLLDSLKNSKSRPTGTLIARNITRQYMKIIHQNLSSGNTPLCQATLRLLISINSFGVTMIREIYPNFYFGMKALGKFFNIRRRQETNETPKSKKTDVRGLYIRFILSFLTHGDSKLKQDVLGIKNFVSGIFPGLSQDSYQVVDEVLTTLYDTVIIDTGIERSAKVSFFNNWVLDQLQKLYHRREKEQSETGQVVADRVHRFLISICCSPGVGICFHDKGWYPPGSIKDSNMNNSNEEKKSYNRVHNIILLRFISNLSPIDDLRQQELLLRILANCPELVQPYWQSTRISFDPRLSHQWLASMTLLQKILSLPIPTFILSKTSTYSPEPPPISTILNNIMPLVANRLVLSKSIQHQSSLVKYKALIVLGSAFQKFDMVLQAFNYVLKDSDNHPSSKTPKIIEEHDSNTFESTWNRVIEKMREEMQRRVPDVQVIISLHSSILANAKQISLGTYEEFVRHGLLYEIVMRLLNYYQKYLPDSISKSNFDIGKLIPDDLGIIPMNIQVHLLEILMTVADFKWFKKSSDSSPSHIFTLFQLYLNASHPQIRIMTEKVILNHLADSTVFEYHTQEIALWLESLSSYGSSDGRNVGDQAAVIKFLESSITQCLQSPYRYFDESLKITQEVSSHFKNCGLVSFKNNIEELPGIPAPLLLTVIEEYRHIPDNQKGVIMSFISTLIKNFLKSNRLPHFLQACIRKLKLNREIHGNLQIKGNTIRGKNAVEKQLDLLDAELEIYCTKFIREISKRKDTSLDADLDHLNLGELLTLWENQPLKELEFALTRKVVDNIPTEVIDHLFSDNGCDNWLLLIDSYQKKLFAVFPDNFDEEIARAICDDLNTTRAKLFEKLIRVSSRTRRLFVEKVLGNQKNPLDGLLDSVVDMASILESYLEAVTIPTQNNGVKWSHIATDDDKRAFHILTERYFLRIFQNLNPSLAQISLSELGKVICKMLKILPAAQIINELDEMIGIPDFVSTNFGVDFLNVMECYLAVREQNNSKRLKDFISNCLHHTSLLMEKDAINTSRKAIDAIFFRIDSLIKMVVPKAQILEANIIGEFIFVLLEKKFEEPSVLKCVTSLISCAYQQKQILGPPLDKVLEAIFKNPQFEILAQPPQLNKRPTTASPNCVTRLSICHLIYTIFQISPNLCSKPAFVESLINIYGASTALADQLILGILLSYEQTTKKSIMTHVITWGPTGSKSGNRNLIGHNVVAESLGLIEPMVMLNSLGSFPLEKELEIRVDSKLFAKIESTCEDPEEKVLCYDPSFFLPLFANLMSFGNIMDCRKFIELNALGFIVVSLSSLVENVRRAGYFLMDEFYMLLEHVNFREKKQILLLLDTFKNSLTERDFGGFVQRVPTLITVFVAHSLIALLNPAHFMYPLINKFSLQRPILDLEDVPMFYNLFYSSTLTYQKERVWILRLLSPGLKSFEDYKIFKRRHVWHIISAYYTSLLVDNFTRKLIIEILFYASSIPQVITDIVIRNGLLTWLHYLSLSTTFSPDNDSALVGPKMLLRVLKGCNKLKLNHRLHKVWIVQVTGFATGLVQILQHVPTQKPTVKWNLNLLHAILRIFHYLTLISSDPIFLPDHASITMEFLKRCEIHFAGEELDLAKSTSIDYSNPSLEDNLDILYSLDGDTSRNNTTINSLPVVLSLMWTLFAHSPCNSIIISLDCRLQSNLR